MWPDDSKRPLTEEGMSRMRKAVRGLARLGVTLDVVLTSPLVRARQTAEIVAGGLEPRPSVVTVESLAPGGTYAAVVADLEKHARKSRIGLVGHEPAIGELAARLIGSRHPIALKKGAVCRIDVDQIPPAGPGDLQWLLTPKILRSLKK
jgi:phosphohistidine phosphatase